jgi:hypothetical protein
MSSEPDGLDASNRGNREVIDPLGTLPVGVLRWNVADDTKCRPEVVTLCLHDNPVTPGDDDVDGASVGTIIADVEFGIGSTVMRAELDWVRGNVARLTADFITVTARYEEAGNIPRQIFAGVARGEVPAALVAPTRTAIIPALSAAAPALVQVPPFARAVVFNTTDPAGIGVTFIAALSGGTIAMPGAALALFIPVIAPVALFTRFVLPGGTTKLVVSTATVAAFRAACTFELAL